ncbi:MAG TPA: DUF2059 domain-containing protein [Afifellaceae bacterium]|nr:DUF2059 domain-containing protein [Afifellaceae bacterium]
MRRMLAAALVAAAVLAGSGLVLAQQPEPPQSEVDALAELMTMELPAERLALGAQLVRLSGTGGAFDELLPNIADQAKNGFIRANPQMQLGIIDVVDRIALTLVPRRAHLDKQLARVWAAAFTEEELQQLIEFYSSDVGKKFAEQQPKVLAIQVATAQEWGRSVSAELTQKVTEELRAAMAAEQNALTSDIAGPATGEPEASPAEPAPDAAAAPQ